MISWKARLAEHESFEGRGLHHRGARMKWEETQSVVFDPFLMFCWHGVCLLLKLLRCLSCCSCRALLQNSRLVGYYGKWRKVQVRLPLMSAQRITNHGRRLVVVLGSRLAYRWRYMVQENNHTPMQTLFTLKNLKWKHLKHLEVWQLNTRNL